jgi:hypothetical protein
MKSPSVTPTIASARSNQSSSPSKRSRNTFMRRSRRLRLKRQRRFSSTWSLNPPKRSLRSAPNCIWRSPTGERGSTKAWPRLVLIPSQSPAAPTGSPTSDRPRLMRSPRKSVPEASKSDRGVFGSTLPVGGMSRALGLAAVSKPPRDILLSLPDTRTAISASKSVLVQGPMRRKSLKDSLKES